MLQRTNNEIICDSDQIGRILKSDYSGRSFWAAFYARPLGVRQLSKLSELEIGESGILVALDLPMLVQNHLMHMGFVPDARVMAVRRAPAGDPTVYLVDGLEIALRSDTARSIRVRALNDSDRETAQAAVEKAPDLVEATR
ncbi:MAG: ferrous iron transport protein A [Acidobacteriota bacterium]|nr:ferrous iron transport protein A [Acidobacteriota bacterium]